MVSTGCIDRARLAVVQSILNNIISPMEPEGGSRER